VGDPRSRQLEDELTGILRRVRRCRGKDDDVAINRQEQILKVYKQLPGALYWVAIAWGSSRSSSAARHHKHQAGSCTSGPRDRPAAALGARSGHQMRSCSSR
jgi:hypothetical protein